MSQFSINTNISFVTVTCCNCGVQFAMTEAFNHERRTYGANFYCPNGHPQCYSKSRVKELQEQLDRRDRELREAKCATLREQNMRELAERKRLTAERKLNRAHKGVCPECNRSFPNLQRHMESKHQCAHPVTKK